MLTNLVKPSSIAVALLAAMLLATQTSCGGVGAAAQAASLLNSVKPPAPKKVATPKKQPRTSVYMGDDMTVVHHQGRTYVKLRDDDNGDGIPDED